MDEELQAFLTERFSGIDQRFAELRRELDERFVELRRELHERSAETRRHFDVVAEGLRGDTRLVAEGHSVLVARIERVEQAIEAMGREILAAVKFSFAELDRRLTRLETLTLDLESRLSRIERER